MKNVLKMFIHVVITFVVFELLLWIHGCIGYNIPLDFTGVSTLTIWAAVLTIVFLVISILGLLNIDNRIKELADLKKDVADTNAEMKQQTRELQRLTKDAKENILKEAEEQIAKIMNRSAARQNLYDRLTQIMGIPDPTAKVKAYTEILKDKNKDDGVNICYILCRRGEAFQMMHRDEEAKRDFEEAINRNPDCIEGYVTMGCFLVERMNDYRGSITFFEKALKIDPTLGYVYSDIANSYAKLGNYAKADEYYAKARDYNVDSAEWYYNKAMTLHNSGDKDTNYEIQESYLLHSLRLNPMFYKSAINLANIYIERKSYRQAQNVLSELIGLGCNPEFVYAIINRAEAMFKMGYLGIALTDFQWAYNLMPNNLFVIQRIAECNISIGNMSIAEQYANLGLGIANELNDHNYDSLFTGIGSACSKWKEDMKQNPFLKSFNEPNCTTTE